MKLLTEFKEFAVKGNAIDMAVGIIVGAAFGKIVTSLVNDMTMPVLGWIMGGKDFTSLRLVLKAATIDPNTQKEIPAVVIRYGVFVNTLVDFIIVALCLFFVVKVINVARRMGGSVIKSHAG
jgi:large conductance mechanosensitive channel